VPAEACDALSPAAADQRAGSLPRRRARALVILIAHTLPADYQRQAAHVGRAPEGAQIVQFGRIDGVT
jgi:hypothetical protein